MDGIQNKGCLCRAHWATPFVLELELDFLYRIAGCWTRWAAPWRRGRLDRRHFYHETQNAAQPHTSPSQRSSWDPHSQALRSWWLLHDATNPKPTIGCYVIAYDDFRIIYYVRCACDERRKDAISIENVLIMFVQKELLRAGLFIRASGWWHLKRHLSAIVRQLRLCIILRVNTDNTYYGYREEWKLFLSKGIISLFHTWIIGFFHVLKGLE